MFTIIYDNFAYYKIDVTDNDHQFEAQGTCILLYIKDSEVKYLF
jgi:hypothetical protein